MSSDGMGLSDEVIRELNPGGPEPDRGPQPAPIGDRPADSASTDAWVEYLVALGVDRTYLTTDTTHQNGQDKADRVPPLRRADLIELADRLGG